MMDFIQTPGCQEAFRGHGGQVCPVACHPPAQVTETVVVQNSGEGCLQFRARCYQLEKNGKRKQKRKMKKLVYLIFEECAEMK